MHSDCLPTTILLTINHSSNFRLLKPDYKILFLAYFELLNIIDTSENTGLFFQSQTQSIGGLFQSVQVQLAVAVS